MARPSDIEDPIFRAALEEAERLIDEGDYTKASRKCAETYLLLLDQRPDLIPPPGAGLGFGFGFGGPGGPGGGAGGGGGGGARPAAGVRAPPGGRAAGLGAGFGPGRAMRRGFWPGQGGIRVIFDEDRKPSLSYEKDRFSLTEALTSFDCMAEKVVNAQREPP